MNIIENSKPEEISIFVPKIKMDHFLKDYRLVQSYGEIDFGTIGQVANNLGIKHKNVEGGIVFSAPKDRMQMFAEKLHFSLTEHFEVE